jgi:hypothetical protein
VGQLEPTPQEGPHSKPASVQWSMFLRQKKPDNAVVVKANWRDNPWFPAVLEEERRLDFQLYPERYIVYLPHDGVATNNITGKRYRHSYQEYRSRCRDDAHRSGAARFSAMLV